jgi:hypothetical protein
MARISGLRSIFITDTSGRFGIHSISDSGSRILDLLKKKNLDNPKVEGRVAGYLIADYQTS